MARKAVTTISKPSIKTILNLVNAAEQIKTTDAIDDNALAFAARLFVMASLPHSDPGNVSHWWRTNGNLTMTIQPGWNGDKCYGLPYGTIPRLLIYWLSSEAVKTRSPIIYRGDNITQFIHRLGYETTGGVKGNIDRIKDQADRLFRSTISFDWTDDRGKGWLNLNVAKGGFKCWKNENDNHVVMNQDFFQMITSSPTPIDMRTIRELRHSALYLDLYTWLCYRAFSIKEPEYISWEQLYRQFGANYKEVREFTRHAKQGLKLIKIHWPELKYETPKGRLMLDQSPPHVKPLIP